jgi:transcriptional regulator GlxA family with amidase domain
MKTAVWALALLALAAMIGLTSTLLVGGLSPASSVVDWSDTEATGARAPQESRNVAIFIHEGVELLDFAGPGEVFAAAGRGRAFNVYTVAASPETILSQGFVRVKPQYTIANCPRPDIVVLPGGRTNIPLGDERVIDWIKRTSREAEVLLSVCTGAFLLAKAGLLDGREATTHWGSIDGLRQAAPKAKVYENRRFVDNGQVVTSAGVSAGIDGALHVVAKLLGPEAAREAARYMEYRWEPGQTNNRAGAALSSFKPSQASPDGSTMPLW